MVKIVSEEIRTEIASELSAWYSSNELISELLTYSVGRILLQSAKRGEDWRAELQFVDIHQIIEWLTNDVLRGADWTTDIDPQGRPTLLMDFSSLEEISLIAGVAKSEAIERQGRFPVRLDVETVYRELRDGYCLVNMPTYRSRKREADLLGHVIGVPDASDVNYRLSDTIDPDDQGYLSLRDRTGKAHLTFRLKNNVVDMMHGDLRPTPEKKFVDYLMPFLVMEQVKIGIMGRQLEYITDINGVFHNIYNLPDELEVDRDLNLFESDITKLPKKLKVHGDLIISRNKISELPEQLYVGGDLRIFQTDITILPKGLTVMGVLNLIGTNITSLPEGLVVGGSFSISGPNIHKLPYDISIGDKLILKDTNITSIPPSISDETEIVRGLEVLTAREFREENETHGMSNLT